MQLESSVPVASWTMRYQDRLLQAKFYMLQLSTPPSQPSFNIHFADIRVKQTENPCLITTVTSKVLGPLCC